MACNLAAGDRAIIFCGDLNAGALSPVYLRLSRLLSDVQKGSKNPAKIRATFPSRRPQFRIDHIFVSNNFKILGIQVPRTIDTRRASDHLPIWS
jgi:endonuclease/exonuclease/phosphatase family metal-dependent hydrolase